MRHRDRRTVTALIAAGGLALTACDTDGGDIVDDTPDVVEEDVTGDDSIADDTDAVEDTPDVVEEDVTGDDSIADDDGA